MFYPRVELFAQLLTKNVDKMEYKIGYTSFLEGQNSINLVNKT